MSNQFIDTCITIGEDGEAVCDVDPVSLSLSHSDAHRLENHTLELSELCRSYTTFSFGDLMLGAVSHTEATVVVLSVPVNNTGRRAGTEVRQDPCTESE